MAVALQGGIAQRDGLIATCVLGTSRSRGECPIADCAARYNSVGYLPLLERSRSQDASNEGTKESQLGLRVIAFRPYDFVEHIERDGFRNRNVAVNSFTATASQHGNIADATGRCNSWPTNLFDHTVVRNSLLLGLALIAYPLSLGSRASGSLRCVLWSGGVRRL